MGKNPEWEQLGCLCRWTQISLLRRELPYLKGHVVRTGSFPGLVLIAVTSEQAKTLKGVY